MKSDEVPAWIRYKEYLGNFDDEKELLRQYLAWRCRYVLELIDAVVNKDAYPEMVDKLNKYVKKAADDPIRLLALGRVLEEGMAGELVQFVVETIRLYIGLNGNISEFAELLKVLGADRMVAKFLKDKPQLMKYAEEFIDKSIEVVNKSGEWNFG